MASHFVNLESLFEDYGLGVAICRYLDLGDVNTLMRTSTKLQRIIKEDDSIWRHFVKKDVFAANDWMSKDPNWLAGKLGRNGLPMRTVKESWFDKLKSSRIDPVYNLLNGNFLVFKIGQDQVHMVDGPLWPNYPELDWVPSNTVEEQLHPESGPSCICCINPDDFAIDSESVIFWKKNLDSVVFSGVCLCGEPKFIGQRTYNGCDLVPAQIQVRWPMVVVVPKKRGRATAVVLDASKNFDVVGCISDDQEMVLGTAEVFFHDDGRICVVYKTPTTWKMSSIKEDRTDNFILDKVPQNFGFEDVATSLDLSALLFVDTPYESCANGWMIRCHHSTSTVETVKIEDNMRACFLLPGKEGQVFVGAESIWSFSPNSDPVVIGGMGRLNENGFSIPYRAVTRETGVTKRVAFASDKATHFFSVNRDGTLKICADDSDSSCFPFMSAEEKIFVGGQNYSEGTNEYGSGDLNYQDWFAYAICGNNVVRLGTIESIPFKLKEPILVSKNRILLAQTNHLFLVVY